MRSTARRVAVILAAPALTLSALAATSSPASAAGTDLNPGIAAAAWLAMQPQDGVVTYKSGGVDFTDYGLSIDIALALQLAGGQSDTVADISDGVAGAIDSYITGEDFGDAGSTYAGPTAKATVLADATGDPTDFGGVNLVQRLEGQVTDTGAAAGRIHDTSTFGDYANVLGQSFAVRALDAVDSPATNLVTDYLLAQQCADGSFKESLPAADSATQDCAAATGDPSIDATATAILSLSSQADDTDVQAAITSASGWLEDHQLASGAFSTGGDFGANANSTGLATSALAIVAQGATPEVTKGAIWVRQHQVHYQDACAPFAASASGAIAYSDADRTAALTDGITADNYGTWLRATAQAAPALLFAPAGDGANVLFTAEYVKAGGTKPVGVTGADPGEQLCALAGTSKVVRWANADGEASLPVTISSRTATTKVSVYDIEKKVGTASVNALGAKKLPVKLKRSVATGRKQVVKVTGLAPGEMVSVTVAWPHVKGHSTGEGTGGQANGKGVFTASFKAPNAPGKAKVTVTGAFANRKASKSFTVTR